MSHPNNSETRTGAPRFAEGPLAEPSPENGPAESGSKPAGRLAGVRTIAACACAAILAFALVAGATAAIHFKGAGPRPEPAPSQSTQAPGEGAEGEAEGCSHAWIPIYGMKHVDAVTETRAVDPTYEERTSAHTVCNDCLAVIDGAAQRHLDETGHSGFTPDVPVTDEVMVDEGGTETVVLEEEADELVVIGERCALCGEERDAPADAETGR